MAQGSQKPAILRGPNLRCDIFISYASEDRAEVCKLQEDLIQAGASSVWVDQPEIDPGDSWQHEIRRGLSRTQVVLAVISKRSVDPKRHWIVFEQEQALRLFRPVIPVLFDDSPLPERLRLLQFADLTRRAKKKERKKSLLRLYDAIGKVTLRPGKQFMNQAPPAVRRFVGREAELREVVRLLEGNGKEIETAKARLAIYAMGGMGKSMLAAEVVRRLSIRYPGGVVYVDRGKGAEDAQMVLQRWTEKADGAMPQRAMMPAEVRDRLRGYGEMLVLIDDVAESEIEQAKQLINALPADSSQLLTTRSQKVKRDLGARLYDLGKLSDEDAMDLLRDRLRALAKPPEEALLRQVVTKVYGHPLSLELVAGRCDKASDLPHLLEELDEILEGEELGLEDLEIEEEEVDKYSSVAASLELSFRGLERLGEKSGSDLMGRFVVLGILPGGALFDEDMAAALWSEGNDSHRFRRQVRSALSVFVRRAMISLDEGTELYLLHPLMRALLHNRLREDNDLFEQTRRRYLRQVIQQAKRAYALPPEEWDRFDYYERHLQYVGSGLARGVAQRLQGELEALVDAPAANEAKQVDFDEAIAKELALGSDFTDAVRRFVIWRPDLGERSRDWLQVGVVCARALGQPLRTIRFLRELGRWHLRRNAQKAEPYLAEAARRARQRRQQSDEFKHQEAIAMSYRGEALRALSQPQEAIQCLQTALEAHQRFDDWYMEATTLKYLGETCWRLGKLEDALTHYERALEIFADHGLLAQRGDIYNKIGSVHFNAGRQKKAIDFFEKALKIHRQVKNRFMEAEDLNDMGIAHQYLGQTKQAIPSLKKAVEIANQIGYLRIESIALSNLASIWNKRKKFAKSKRLAEQALQRAREVADKVPQSWALNWIGLAHQEAGELKEAERCFREALELSAGIPRGLAACYGNLGWLQARFLGRPEEGLKNLRAAVQVLQDNKLEQAYGGLRLKDFRKLIKKAQTSE